MLDSVDNMNAGRKALAAAVPFNDLKRQTASLESELAAAINRVLRSGWYILGPECAAFDEEFAAYCGVAAGC